MPWETLLLSAATGAGVAELLAAVGLPPDAGAVVHDPEGMSVATCPQRVDACTPAIARPAAVSSDGLGCTVPPKVSAGAYRVVFGPQDDYFSEAGKARARPQDRGSYGSGPFDTFEDFHLYDRCITRGVLGSLLGGRRRR